MMYATGVDKENDGCIIENDPLFLKMFYCLRVKSTNDKVVNEKRKDVSWLMVHLVLFLNITIFSLIQNECPAVNV